MKLVVCWLSKTFSRLFKALGWFFLFSAHFWVWVIKLSVTHQSVSQLSITKSHINIFQLILKVTSQIYNTVHLSIFHLKHSFCLHTLGFQNLQIVQSVQTIKIVRTLFVIEDLRNILTFLFKRWICQKNLSKEKTA